MKSIWKLIFCLGFFYIFFTNDIIAQSPEKVDSLKSLLEAAEDDSSKIYLLNWIANYTTNPAELLKYAEQANDLANKINHLEGKAKSLKHIGTAYERRGDLLPALNYNLRALQLFSKLENKEYMSSVINTISVIYLKQKNFQLSLEYLKKSLELSLEIGDSINIGGDFNNIGETYRLMDEYDSALFYFNKAFAVYNKIDYEYGVAYALGNIGLVHAAKNQSDSAEFYIDKSTKILEKMEDRYPIAVYKTYMADIYKDKGDLNSALEYAHESLQIAEEEELKEQIRDAAKKLSELYGDLENYKRAFQYQSQYIAYRDSINNEETIRKMADLRTEYEVAQKQAEVELLNQRQKTQQIINISLAIILLLMGSAAFIWYQNSQSRKKTNQMLEQQKAEIQKQRDQLEEVVNMKDKFFGIISHDLRSPVNSLQGIAQLLNHYVKSRDQEQVELFVKMAEQSVNNLSSLIDNLLSWAMTQQGELPYYPEKIKLHYTIEEVMRLFSGAAASKNIRFNCRIEENMELWADRDSVFALLRNLVNNALKFTKENGEVLLDAKSNHQWAVIEVKDTGTGISKDKIDSLFSGYDKAKSTKGTSGEKGSGLGLALCKEIIELNHGKIEVESVINKGTTFRIKLPLSPVKSS